MRLWSIHPGYLDGKGLVALWREALLAKKVLSGKTKGYTHHPQLHRFMQCQNPRTAINAYLTAIYNEAVIRGYAFQRQKIGRSMTHPRISVTTGQMIFEMGHFKRKLWKRDRKKYYTIRDRKTFEAHPLFRVVRGKIEDWEKT